LLKGSIERVKRVWTPLFLGLLSTPFCLLVALESAGAGHGDYFWAKVIYPYTMLSAVLLGSIAIPFALFAVLQLPMYGLVLSIAWLKNRLGLAALILFALHALTVLACF
jgi:hypothetical protein